MYKEVEQIIEKNDAHHGRDQTVDPVIRYDTVHDRAQNEDHDDVRLGELHSAEDLSQNDAENEDARAFEDVQQGKADLAADPVGISGLGVPVGNDIDIRLRGIGKQSVRQSPGEKTPSVNRALADHDPGDAADSGVTGDLVGDVRALQFHDPAAQPLRQVHVFPEPYGIFSGKPVDARDPDIQDRKIRMPDPGKVRRLLQHVLAGGGGGKAGQDMLSSFFVFRSVF